MQGIQSIAQRASTTQVTKEEIGSHVGHTLPALELPLSEDPDADECFITLMSEDRTYPSVLADLVRSPDYIRSSLHHNITTLYP